MIRINDDLPVDLQAEKYVAHKESRSVTVASVVSKHKVIINLETGGVLTKLYESFDRVNPRNLAGT